jgi:hypothetical protein
MHNIISIDKNIRLQRDNAYNQVVVACRDILISQLSNAFILDNVDDILFRLAEQAGSNQEQSEMFSAMREMRISESKVKKEFTRLMVEDFDQFWAKEYLPQGSTDESVSLSLLGDEELEEDLAVKRIATKCTLTCGADISQVNARFSIMSGNNGDKATLWTTERISEHVRTIVNSLTSHLVVKLILYKKFEVDGLAVLKTVFKKLNKVLAGSVTIPRTTPSTIKYDHHGKAQGHLDLSQSRGVSGPFEELQGLVPFNGRNSGPGRDISVESVLSALSTLQPMQMGMQEHPLNIKDVRKVIIGESEDGSARINRVDSSTIDLISMLFKHILGDNAVPPEIRALLAQMQIPMLKVALADKAFFNESSHPARKLLNNLEVLAFGWDSDDSGKSSIKNEIESIIRRIVNDFKLDVGIFDETNRELEAIIREKEERSDTVEVRTVQASDGADKVSQAELVVKALVSESLSSYGNIPSVAISLLENHWSKVLGLRVLQKGADSKEVAYSVDVMNKLLWSVTTDKDKERSSVIRSVPDIIQSLRNGLSSFGNQTDVAGLFNELKRCHVSVMSGRSYQDPLKTKIITASANTAAEREQPSEQATFKPASAAHIKRANMVKVGDWVEFSDGLKKKRVKLSWKSTSTGNLLFVNNKGVKAVEMPINEFALLCEDGKTHLLKNHVPLVDRAIASMMATVHADKS